METNSKSFQVLIIVLILIFSPLCLTRGFSNSDSTIQSKLCSSLNQEITYDYNSTSGEEEFNVSWNNLELDYFNSITLSFIITGDGTDSSGMKIIFNINETTIEFLIDSVYQDQTVHEITRAFEYPQPFLGSTNITIICEGNTYFSSWSGTLTILTNTNIEPVVVPQISETPFFFPIIPESFMFQGSLSKLKQVSVISAFFNDEELDRCNLTLEFSSNDFDALSEYIEIEINGSIIETRNFEEDSINSHIFLLPLKLGLNVIIFHFSIDMCLNIVEINNIQLSGFAYSLESAVPTNILEFKHWVGMGISYTFDLSSLKPQSNNPSQILQINIDYGYIGTIISPAIEYSLQINSEELAEGSISAAEQTNLPNSLEIQTYTSFYQFPLTFSISGDAEGEGIFYILNTSKIEIKPISGLSEGFLEETLISEEVITTPVAEPRFLTFYDVFYSDNLVSGYNITVFCNLSNDLGTQITSEITLEIDNTLVINSIVFTDNNVNITSKIPLLFSGYHEVKLIMTIYGNGNQVTIKNLKYQITSHSPSSSTPPDFPTDPIEELNGDINTKEPVSLSRAFSLGIVGLFDILALVSLVVRSNKKKKRISGIIENFDLTIDGLNTQQGWLSSFITDTKKLFSRATETAIKALLSFFCLAYLFGKYFFHNQLLNNIYSIAEKELGSISFVSGGNAGYFLFFIFLCISTVPWYSIIILSTSSTYYEDQFFLATIIGFPTVIALPVSWVLLIFYIFRNTHSFDSGWTILLPLCFIALYFLTFRLGKVKEKQRLSAIFDFIRKGKVPVTMSKQSESKPLADIVSAEENYTSRQLEEQKGRIRNLIITEIDHAHPVPLERFAEAEKLPLDIAEKHLMEISNESPSLGKYYRLEKYYVKSIKNVEIENQVIVNEEEQLERNTEVLAVKPNPTQGLDRFAIERDSEINWIGIVRHRPEPSEGWITLPAEMKNQAELGEEYDVFLFAKKGEEVAFITDLRKSSANSWFLYIPAAICSKSNLYGKEVSAFIKKHKESEGFPWKKEEDLEEKEMLEWKKTKKVIEWEGTIRKGSGAGTGWITIPTELRESVEPGKVYDLTLIDSMMRTNTLTAKLSATAKGWGFYIPKALCLEYSLISEEVNCYIYQMEHFPVKISADKIVRLPDSVVEEYEIKENDIFEVEAIVERAIFKEVVLITKIDRSNKSRNDEFLLLFRLSDVPKSTDARIRILNSIDQLPSELVEEEDYETFYLPSIFPDAILGKVDENRMIIFKGNHVPIFTPIEVNLLELIHYFGCYYADGTKKGWAWRINASTPEQAVYYIGKYNELIYGNRLEYRLTYSKKPSDKRTKANTRSDLINYWKKNASINLIEDRIKLRETKHDNIRKWNKCGSLGIRDNRNLVMEVHLRILNEIIVYLNTCIYDELIWEFLFGILEGDGTVSGGKGKFGIGFSCHKDDKIILKMLKRLHIKHSVDLSRLKTGTGSSIQINFWLFEVILNLEILSKRLFIFYPKRRRLFIERLLKQSTVRYLMKKQSNLSPPARSKILAYQLDNETIIKLLNEFQDELEHICINEERLSKILNK